MIVRRHYPYFSILFSMFVNPRKKKHLDKFLRYLDTYSANINTCKNQTDLINLIHATNLDFNNNNYSSPEYVGESNPYRNKNKTQLYSMPFTPDPYSLPFCNLFREPIDSDSNSILQLDYTHTYNLITTPPKPRLKPKTKVEINASISSLTDLITIIDTYKYNDACEYNIDLKSLTNIREELVQLNSMIGMKQLKTSIMEQLLYFIQELHVGTATNTAGEQVKTHEFKHTVIYGPPGTGKTEIAKIIGKMYSKIGVLEKNVFKKVTRNDLVAGYLGQTAMKTKTVINECLGGVLFIDEAYSLAPFMNGELDSYSKECVDILCETLSDHKHDLMVIIAGYEEELNTSFFSANSGLESRFIWRFKIDNYSATELRDIWFKMVSDSDWTFTKKDDITVKWFEDKKKTFAHYGRDMEMLFTYTKISHSKRVYGKPVEERKRITLEDLNQGYETFKKNKKVAKEKDSSDALYGLYV